MTPSDFWDPCNKEKRSHVQNITRGGEAELCILEIMCVSSPLKCRCQAVVRVSAFMRYPKSLYFLVLKKMKFYSPHAYLGQNT